MTLEARAVTKLLELRQRLEGSRLENRQLRRDNEALGHRCKRDRFRLQVTFATLLLTTVALALGVYQQIHALGAQ